MTELDTTAPGPAPGAAGPAPMHEDEAREHRIRNMVEWVAIVAGALAVALIVKTFLIQAFFIPSLSMFPTLDEGDRVLVNKLSYQLHEVNRGDLIVFKRPDGSPESDIKDLIKRVVALPGETVSGRGNAIYIDGVRLTEPYLDDDVLTADFAAVEVPEGHVFVMGDNRDESQDSRIFGPIDEDTIVGRAFIKVWPVTELELL